MKFIIPGQLYILDQKNSLNMYETDIAIVKVLRAISFNKYEVQSVPLDESSPTSFVISGSLLTPLNNSNVIIRHSLQYPLINKEDLKAINNIIQKYINDEKPSNEDIDRLKMISTKVSSFNDIYKI